MSCDTPAGDADSAMVGVGLLGFGVLGAAVADALARVRSRDLWLVGAAVRDLTRSRPALPATTRLTRRPLVVVNDPRVDVVLDVSDDAAMASRVVCLALRLGKPAVTANAALLRCDHGDLGSAHPEAPLFRSAAVARQRGGVDTAAAVRLVLADIAAARPHARQRPHAQKHPARPATATGGGGA